MYKKNPRSRVFAPLAESFRKLGMLDDAFKILKDGIRYHPNYTLGYIVLAHCYFDQGKYELTYNTLRPIAHQNSDNISLQKIFAQSCMNLGYLEEALDTYKYLLFMNPKDKFFAEQVKRLEDDLHIGHKKLTLDQLIKAPDLEKLPVVESNDDDWVQVSFAKDDNKPEQKVAIPETNEDQWTMEKTGPSNIHPILKEEKIESKSLEDDFFADEFEELGDIEEVNDQEITPEVPIISHTLIDLYCSQKYFDKAIELLEKIIELNPNDKASVAKLSHVKNLKASESVSSTSVQNSEEDGHAELISIIENRVKTKSPKEIKIAAAFENFLKTLKEEAQTHR
jgi:pentatricopeptide repeat protein